MADMGYEHLPRVTPLNPFQYQCLLKQHDSTLRREVFNCLVTEMATEELIAHVQKILASATYQRQQFLEYELQQHRVHDAEVRIKLLQVWAEADREKIPPKESNALTAITEKLAALSLALSDNRVALEAQHEAWFHLHQEIGKNVITQLVNQFGKISKSGLPHLEFDLGKFGKRMVSFTDEMLTDWMNAFKPGTFEQLQKIHPEVNLLEPGVSNPHFIPHAVALNNGLSQLCACAQLGGNKEEERLTGGALLTMIRLANRASVFDLPSETKAQQTEMLKEQIRLCYERKNLLNQVEEEDVQLRRVKKDADKLSLSGGPKRSAG